MRVAKAVAAGVCTSAGLALGWPWGVVAIGGCVALSLAGVWLLSRAAGLCWRSAPPSRRPLRVLSVRPLPPAETATISRTATERELP